MNAFDIAWSLLKNVRTKVPSSNDPIFSVKEIRNLRDKMKRERDTGVYDVNRGSTKLEQYMGINPLRQLRFSREGLESPDYGLNAKTSDKTFEEGYKERMDTSPRLYPTKVVRRTDYDGRGGRFTLEDDEGKEYSSLSGNLVDPEYSPYSTANPTLMYLSGKTTPGERRKGYYEKLLNTILQNNINIQSTARNSMSGPFHQKFQGRLPPNIDFKEKDRDFTYMKNPILDSKNQTIRQVQGWGDLQPDYNVVPMINVKNTINPRLSDLAQEHKGTEQLKLNNRGFLTSSNPENPMHDIHELMFTTPQGERYSTANVLADKYNPDYENHPYYEGLGHLFG